MGVLFFKVASGLCIYFIASSLWGMAERKLLPKPAAVNGMSKVESRAEAKARAKAAAEANQAVAARNANGDGAAARNKSKNRGTKS
jgi:YidC/Oxa1 family membrane protein insertase